MYSGSVSSSTVTVKNLRATEARSFRFLYMSYNSSTATARISFILGMLPDGNYKRDNPRRARSRIRRRTLWRSTFIAELFLTPTADANHDGRVNAAGLQRAGDEF